MATSSPRPDRPGLPSADRLLLYLYGGRVALAFITFGAAVLVWTDLQPLETLTVSVAMLAAILFTAGSYAYTSLPERAAGNGFRYGQCLFDVLFVTAVVLATGGAASAFASAYVLVICAAAILLSFRGSMLVGLLIGALYFAGVTWRSGSLPEGTMLLQVGLFVALALVMGYLGNRLHETDMVLGEVETELRRLQLNTDEILSTISTCILTVDGEGRLAYINPAAAELLRLPATTWIGQPITDELDSRAPHFGEIVNRSADRAAPVPRAVTGAAPESGMILGVSTTVIAQAGGGRPSVTAIFQNITEKIQVEALRRRAERLEAVAELSGSLAHEIKNPLASIRSAAEQLRQGGLDDEDRDLLEGLMMRESDRVNRLLRDFLDFARLHAERFEPVSITDLVQSVVMVVRAHPDAEGRQVTVAEPGGASGMQVPGDEDLLHRALFNLVLNAVQWAGEGGSVDVRFDGTRTDVVSGDGTLAEAVCIRVSDTGPGFSADEMDRVFDPFYTARIGGTGLGLALVQRAAEAHGGAITIEPTRKHRPRGGIVDLYLPVERPAPARQQPTLQPASS